MIINELTGFSNRYGKDNDLVLAGGGNTSAKDGNTMYIKASGTALAAITPEGFVKMDRTLLAAMFGKAYPQEDSAREAAALADLMAARLPGEEAKRPSVETTLHALFPQTFVLHLHPALVNGLTCSRDGEKIAKELFGDDFVWVGLCKPGYILAKLCDGLMREYASRTKKDVSILILQNHGVFVAADTTAGLNELLNRVMAAIGQRVTRTPDLSANGKMPEDAPAITAQLASLYGKGSVAVFDNNNEILRFSQSVESAKPLLLPFTPDHIVYCKAYPLFIRGIDELEQGFREYEGKNGYPPKIVIVKNMGFAATGKNEKDALTAKLLFNDAIKVAVYAESFGGPLHMTQKLTDFIVNWEVEAYRQKQN